MLMNPRILIIKHGALGDFFIALGAFQAIRSFHKDAKIFLLTTPAYASLAKDTGLFDEILEDTRPRFYELRALYKLRQKLKNLKITRVYDLQNSPRTAFYFKLWGPGLRPQWNGIAPGCSHPQQIPHRRHLHAFPRFKDQLAVAGIHHVPWPNLDWIPSQIPCVNLPKPFVLLIPGSSVTRQIKRWPAHSYAALAHELLKKHITPVLLGGPDDTNALDVIRTQCPEALDLSGKTTLYHIVALARQARAVIGNDTGPLHMASLVKCPTLVLWSRASDPKVFAPQGDHVRVLVKPDLNDLSVQDVYATLMEMLNGP